MDKIGKPGNFEEVHFFPVSAPASYKYNILSVIGIFKKEEQTILVIIYKSLSVFKINPPIYVKEQKCWQSMN